MASPEYRLAISGSIPTTCCWYVVVSKRELPCTPSCGMFKSNLDIRVRGVVSWREKYMLFNMGGLLLSHPQGELRTSHPSQCIKSCFSIIRILKNLSARSFRGILILSTILSTIFLSYIPILGPFQSFMLMSWVDACVCKYPSILSYIDPFCPIHHFQVLLLRVSMIILTYSVKNAIHVCINRHVWIAQGFSLSRRVRYQEERWAYFFGFGR